MVIRSVYGILFKVTISRLEIIYVRRLSAARFGIGISRGIIRNCIGRVKRVSCYVTNVVGNANMARLHRAEAANEIFKAIKLNMKLYVS